MEKRTPEERGEWLLNNANDAARHVLRVYLIFLLIGAYIFIIIGSTTDEQLLRVSRISLPLLDVGIPILAFYILTPWIALLLHFNLLLQLYLLATKLHTFDLALNDIGPTTKRDEYRNQLFPFLFSHMLVGHHHGRLARWLLKLAIWVTVLLLPLLLLVATQTRFLPYHSEPITWSHRAAVGLDVFLLWTLWPMIAAWGRRAQTRRTSGLMFLGVTTPVLLLHAVTVAVIPGEPMDNSLARTLFDTPRWRDPPHTFFHRNLYLAEGVFVAGEPSSEIVAALRRGDRKEQVEVRKKILGINLAKRDLRFANFLQAILPKADLRNADLEGAFFSSAQLQDADLSDAQLRGANLSSAQLQGANLSSALQGADLSHAQLQGAFLTGAQLQGANLSSAQLQGADLSSAQLQGADLSIAQLQGANLWVAQLQGANLSSAQLQGTALMSAQLQGADLSHAQLQGADLSSAELELSDLSGARTEALSQTVYDRFKTTLPEEQQAAVADSVGQPAMFTRSKTQDTWCNENLRNKLKLKGCLPADSRSNYEKKLVEFLTRLSCEDEYVAHYIPKYRFSSNCCSPFNRDLATALLDKAELPGCKGVHALTQDEKEQLRKIIKRYDEKAGKPQEKAGKESEPRP